MAASKKATLSNCGKSLLILEYETLKVISRWKRVMAFERKNF
jgi:hypothetical protein